MEWSREGKDARANLVKNVRRQVATLLDEFTQSVAALRAVLAVLRIRRILSTLVLADTDNALSIVERGAGEVLCLVEERLISDRAMGQIAGLVRDGFVGHCWSVCGLAVEGV